MQSAFPYDEQTVLLDLLQGVFYILDSCSVSSTSRYHLHSQNLAQRDRICFILRSPHVEDLEVCLKFYPAVGSPKLAIGKLLGNHDTRNLSLIPHLARTRYKKNTN